MKRTTKKPVAKSKAASSKKITPLGAYKDYWIKYFVYKSDTSTRAEMLWAWGINQLIMIPILIAALGLDKQFKHISIALIILIYAFALATLMPSISLYCRRLRDIGLSQDWIWLILVMFIPVVGLIMIVCGWLFLAIAPGDMIKPNKYRK